MTKIKFLLALHDRLSNLPQDEVEERLSFYSEMIEDRMEEGLSEEDAVSAIGAIDDIAMQITSEIPLTKIAKENLKAKRKMKAWEIILLVLGSPIWFSFLVALFAVLFSVYVSIWSVIISFWAVFVSFVCCGFGFIVVGIGFTLGVNTISGVALITSGIICTGVSILVFFFSKWATKTLILLTKKFMLWIKSLFIKKEEV